MDLDTTIERIAAEELGLRNILSLRSVEPVTVLRDDIRKAMKQLADTAYDAGFAEGKKQGAAQEAAKTFWLRASNG